MIRVFPLLLLTACPTTEAKDDASTGYTLVPVAFDCDGEAQTAEEAAKTYIEMEQRPIFVTSAQYFTGGGEVSEQTIWFPFTDWFWSDEGILAIDCRGIEYSDEDTTAHFLAYEVST